jgi:hypothetical protein
VPIYTWKKLSMVALQGGFFLLVNCVPLEALEVQARVMACTTQSGKGIGCEQCCQEA